MGGSESGAAGFKRPESVLVVIHTPRGECLLLERVTPRGFWQSVTGTLRRDETPAAAAVREVREETGLVCTAPGWVEGGTPDLVDTGTTPERLETGASELAEAGTPELLEAGAPELVEGGTPELLKTGASELTEASTPAPAETGAPEAVETDIREAVETGTSERLEVGAPELVESGIARCFPILPEWRHRYAPGVTENLEHLWYLPLRMTCPVTLNDAEHRAWRWLGLEQAIATVSSWTNREALERLRAGAEHPIGRQ